MHRLGLAIQWREDVDTGEMIQCPGYTKDYLTFDGIISSKELNAIVAAINAYYTEMDSHKRVVWCGGELRPASQRQRSLF